MIPVLPIAYFGSIAYFRELGRYEEVVLESKEHFPKQSYRNRCEVVAANGLITLSIPVQKPNGSKTLVEDILIDQSDWKDIHWRTIVSAYQSSPYFDYYGREIEELIFADCQRLIDLDVMITNRILKWLDLEVKLNFSEDFKDYQKDDLRSTLCSKHHFQETEQAPYIQVFPGKDTYKQSISILDAILCEGPLARNLILVS